MTAGSVLWESARWYITVSALAWLMYPFIFRAVGHLPSRGIPFVRPLGLLLAALVPWWLSALGLTPYSTTLIVAIPVVLALLAWVFEARTGELWTALSNARNQILLIELLTVVLFAGYVVFRCYNPAIQHTEKPMELTFLTSLIHTRSMPPPDPWFLGKSINYYYLGYLLMALPARLSYIVPAHAFNLALATLFATATVAAVGVATDLTRSHERASRVIIVASGFLAALFLVGIGNLVTPIAFIQHPLRTLHADWWQGVGWNASRVISDGPNQQTINEFPAFSFVLGDLHPHVLDYPMFISSIGIGLALARAKQGRLCLYGASALAGILAAAMYATNSWDMPPGMLLAIAGILIATGGLSWRERIKPLGVLAASALVTVFPFWLHYVPAVGLPDDNIPVSVRTAPILGTIVKTLGVVTWPRTSTAELLKVHGLFLAIAVLFLVTITIPAIRTGVIARRVLGWTTLGLLVASFIIRFPGLFWFIGPAVLCSALLVLVQTSAPERYHLALFALAFSLLSITELVFLEDAFGDRMNTVFKLYFQVWAIFAVATAVALPFGLRWLHGYAGKLGSGVAGAAFGVVILGATLYPPISAYHWTNGFKQSNGLDGIAYIRQYAPDEISAIDWLDSNSVSTDHLLEAPGCSYGEDGAFPDNVFSMATGLSTPLGWQFHEYQWRLGDPDISNEINQRKADVKTIYDTPNSTLARSLLDTYDIRFIIVGPIERNGYAAQCDGGAPYSQTGLDQLSQIGWLLAYKNPSVTIYERP